MRDRWDDSLQEKLSSLRMDDETPSWVEFSSSMGILSPDSSTGRTRPLFRIYTYRWRVAAALLLLLAGGGFYHLFRLEPAQEKRVTLPSIPISAYPVVAPVQPVIAEESVPFTLSSSRPVATFSLSGLSEAVAIPLSDPPLQNPVESKAVSVNHPPSRQALREGWSGGEASDYSGVDDRRSDSQWSAALYAYGQGSWGQGGTENSMMRTGQFMSEQSSAIQLSAPRTGAMHHSPPLVLGLKLRRSWNDKWGWETGVQFSRYRSTGSLEGEMADYTYRQTVDYVGLPLGLSYRLFYRKSWSLTPVAGLMAETALSARGVLRVTSDGGITPSESYRLDAKGILLSAYAGTELSARIAGNWWLTVEPGISQRIGAEPQPLSYRGEHALFFRVGFGIRCDF